MLFIRQATLSDLPRQMDIYAGARLFMAETGNPGQWGPDRWPPESLVRDDVTSGKSYVCVSGEDPSSGRVVGTFYFDFGDSPEPDYAALTEGAWPLQGPYGVIHRIASDRSEKGIGTACITWAAERSGGDLRIDTHENNKPMRSLLSRLGFVPCGKTMIGGTKERLCYCLAGSSGDPAANRNMKGGN